MVWGEVQHSTENGYYISFRQQKTKGVEILPIPVQAFQILGERKEADSKVFEGLKYSAHTNSHIVRWTAKAGITKHITFHSFRHTYATLQITYGTDFFTVQKMLGHKHAKTTQVYAKIVDKKKQEATNSFEIDFGKK